MPKYNLLFTVSGYSKGVVEAEDEEEAREKIDNGDWESRGSGDNVEYVLEEIEEGD
jgi:hypothetical protein